MRIVIIGEFSSFAKNLSAGFRSLGHECFVFSWGDGFKKIVQEGDSYTVNAKFLGGGKVGFLKYVCRSAWECLKLRREVRRISKKEKWDVVLILSPGFIRKSGNHYGARFSKEMIFSLLKSFDNIFLSSCGGDVPYYDYWSTLNWKNRNKVENEKSKFLSRRKVNHFKFISSFIKKVIPVMYDYAEPWRKSSYTKSYTVCPTIPLPVETQKFEPLNIIKDKIVIFHGITRPNAKGTDYILPAMERIQKNYPDKVECIAKGGMPLDEYLKVINKTNILIDQVYASSSGMNALYALAQGKVLLGGNVPENSIENHYPDIPIIDIGPDSEQIYEELEKLINHPEEILRLSQEGRKYVEKVHDSKIVAAKYIETFKSFGTGL